MCVCVCARARSCACACAASLVNHDGYIGGWGGGGGDGCVCVCGGGWDNSFARSCSSCFFIHRVLVTWYFQESLCELSCKIKSVYSGLFFFSFLFSTFFFFSFFQRAKYVHNNIFDLNCELF